VSENKIWDEDRAEAMIGKTMLVGMTYLDIAGDRLEQFYGEVVSVDARKGIELRLAGSRVGETFMLPPDLSSVFAARAGEYRLRATGEIVVNPDFTATWQVYPRGSGAA
jgi:hypothetical protein